MSDDDMELSSRQAKGNRDKELEDRRGLRQVKHLLLHRIREEEDEAHVHVYSLAEWKDSDFWRAIVGGAPPLPCCACCCGSPCATKSLYMRLVIGQELKFSIMLISNTRTEFLATKLFVSFSILIVLSAGQTMAVSAPFLLYA
jgi:hypothetical protein